MNTDEREKLNTDAILNPAPNLAEMSLRPFNDGTMSLCGQLGLSLFTLDAIFQADPGTGSPTERATAAIGKLGFQEMNRQSHFLFFMLGYGRSAMPAADDPQFSAKLAEAEAAEDRAIVEMTRLIQQPGAYETHVMPWLLRQRYHGSLVPMMLQEWGRFMKHFLAASFSIVPKEGDDDPAAPPNS